VRPGDFCRFGDRIGTVEEVGLRSTRVRTLDRTVVTVPNAEFATLQLENFALRDRIWLHAKLGLRYETTPDQLRFVLVEIRKLLYAHPRLTPDPARVRFVGFGNSSLDLEVFAYVRTTDFDEFLAVREDVYLRIMDVVAESGSGFAFPSQTAYLARDSGLDESKGLAAQERVRGWRERGELWLPEFPAHAIDELRDTLEYPADGSASHP
jgi:MscS family membrane protein